jgi:hypothetical protein
MPLSTDGDTAIEEPAPVAWFPEEQAPDEELSSTTDPTLSDAPSPEGITTDEARIAKKELDPRYRQDFEGLLYLGDLRDEFTWAGHSFSIKTLTIDEMLRAGLMVKKYEESIGSNRAYITAVVAACLVRVDGKPIYSPLGSIDEDGELEAKFRYVRESWYSWTADRIYNQLMILEARVAQIIEAMGEAGG